METYVRSGNLALRRALSAIKGHGGRLFEGGCGTGRFLRAILRQRPELVVFGCDIDDDAIATGRSFGDGIAYAQASLTHPPYTDGAFDIAVLFDVVEHLAEPRQALAEVHRVLRPGGLLHALVPCEGQPLTLHWLLWRLDLGADLKERHVGHVQRFTHASIKDAFSGAGFAITDVHYSMHPMGQVRDILSYVLCEEWARRWHLNNPLFRLAMVPLWMGSYLESNLLARVGLGAVAMHLTARRL